MGAKEDWKTLERNQKDTFEYWEALTRQRMREAGSDVPRRAAAGEAVLDEAKTYAEQTGDADLAKELRHGEADAEKEYNTKQEEGIFGDADEAAAKNAAIDANLKASDHLADIEGLGEEHFFIDPEDVEKFRTGDPLEIERLFGKLPMEDLDEVRDILGESRFEEFEAPGEGREAQVRGLERFETIAEGGPDAVAEAEYQRRRKGALQGQRAQEEAILRDMETRGLRGSGEELQTRLTAAQGAGESQFMAGTEAAAQQQQRRDAATGAAAGLGGEIRGADFGEQFAVTGAQEAGDVYRSGEQLASTRGNIQAGRGAMAGDVAQANRAAWESWARENQTSDANVELANKILGQNVGASEQYWSGTRPGAVQMGMGADEFTGETAQWSADQPTPVESAAGAVTDVVEGVAPVTEWFDDDDDDED